MAVKTLLAVANDTADAIGVQRPSELYGSSRPDDRRWLQLLYEAGEWIRDNFDYPTLKQKYSFATVSGQKFYPLPGNFWRLLQDTQFDDTNQWALLGPVSDGHIATRDKGIVDSDIQLSYRIVGAAFDAAGEDSFDVSGGYIELSTTPTDVRTLSIEYIQANWFYPLQWVTATAYTSGNLRSANRNIYKCTANVDSSDTRPSGETSADGTSGTWQLWRGLYNETTADTDYPIVDPHTLKFSLRAAWCRSKGLDATTYEQRAVNSALNSKGRFQGHEGVNSDGIELGEFPWISEDYLVTGF